MFLKKSVEDSTVSFETCGRFVSRGEWIHPTRILHSYEILFVTAGKVPIREENREYCLEKNDVLLLSPEREHGGICASRDVSFFWLHFRGNIETEETFFRFDEHTTTALQSLFRMLLHNANTPLYPASSSEYLTRLILNEISYLSDRNISSDGLLHRIAEYIAANLALRPSVTDIADHFGYNPDYLCRLFKKRYGRTLQSFVIAQTVKHAESLLLRSEMNLSETANALGFENENTFSKFFKYHEGVTPSQYASVYYNTHVNHS